MLFLSCNSNTRYVQSQKIVSNDGVDLSESDNSKRDTVALQSKCKDLFSIEFFKENGIFKSFEEGGWKGEFENNGLKIEYWSNNCLNHGLRYTSKTDCAKSFYHYQNGILATYDSTSSSCEKIFFYQRGIVEDSLPSHVLRSLR